MCLIFWPTENFLYKSLFFWFFFPFYVHIVLQWLPYFVLLGTSPLFRVSCLTLHNTALWRRHWQKWRRFKCARVSIRPHAEKMSTKLIKNLALQVAFCCFRCNLGHQGFYFKFVSSYRILSCCWSGIYSGCFELLFLMNLKVVRTITSSVWVPLPSIQSRKWIWTLQTISSKKLLKNCFNINIQDCLVLTDLAMYVEVIYESVARLFLIMFS